MVACWPPPVGLAHEQIKKTAAAKVEKSSCLIISRVSLSGPDSRPMSIFHRFYQSARCENRSVTVCPGKHRVFRRASDVLVAMCSRKMFTLMLHALFAMAARDRQDSDV